MAAINYTILLKDALELIQKYKDPGFRAEVNKALLTYQGPSYKGRPIFQYIQVLVGYSDIFHHFYNKASQNKPLANSYARQPGVIENFLTSCDNFGQSEITRLNLLTSPNKETPPPDGGQHPSPYSTDLPPDSIEQFQEGLNHFVEGKIKAWEYKEKVAEKFKQVIEKYQKQFLVQTSRIGFLANPAVKIPADEMALIMGLSTVFNELVGKKGTSSLTDPASQKISQQAWDNVIYETASRTVDNPDWNKPKPDRSTSKPFIPPTIIASLPIAVGLAVKNSFRRYLPAIKGLLNKLDKRVYLSGLGGLLGAVLTSGGGPTGMLLGFAVGAAAPVFINNGGGNIILNGLKAAASPAITGLSMVSQIANFTPQGRLITAIRKFGPYIIAGTVGLLIMIIQPTGLSRNISLLNEAVIDTPAYSVGPGDLNSCTFTRLGQPTNLKSSILMGWINDAAAAEGVPASIIASLAKHESPEFVTDAGDDHNDIKNNNYCVSGPAFCVNGGVLAHSGECTSPDLAAGYKTGQAKGVMQVVDIYNPDIDVCNIQQNIRRGTRIFKEKLSGSITDETSVKTAVCRYFGVDNSTCAYSGSYDYGQEVWGDFLRCQPLPADNTIVVPIIREGHSCPVAATYVAFPGYSSIEPGKYSYVCGHHRPIFNAIDVGVNSAGGTQVVAVVSGTVEDNTNPYGGNALWLTGDDGQNYYYAHLKSVGLVTGRVAAGQVIGSIASSSDRSSANNGVAHVHFSAGTRGNRQSFNDPANIPAGRLLDSWCGINVCQGNANVAY